ncbi:DUF1028 domain-containing protein [Myxococcaceae bacterium GXIMD 01537]
MTKRLLAAISALCLGAPALAADEALPYNPRVLGTRSIVACDATAQECGLAVVSFPTAVSSLVAYGRPGMAVATQLYPSVDDAEALLARMGAGETPQAALDAVVAADPARDARQFGVAALGPDGTVRVAQYTGALPWPQKCEVKGATFVVQASAQTSAQICDAMAQGFTQAPGSLAYKLLAALKAGARVGGDERGERAGIVRVWSGTSPVSAFTHVVADAVVYGSSRPLAELEKSLDRFMGQTTPSHPEDLVVVDLLTTRRVQQALRALGYYRGPAHGLWTEATESALGGFLANNVFVPKPTVVTGGVRRADGPLLRFLVDADPDTLVPAPR